VFPAAARHIPVAEAVHRIQEEEAPRIPAEEGVRRVPAGAEARHTPEEEAAHRSPAGEEACRIPAEAAAGRGRRVRAGEGERCHPVRAEADCCSSGDVERGRVPATGAVLRMGGALP